MLQFFRKYQKFFFIFITVIIVCTFVFFGTYQALAPTLQRKEKDETVFRAQDGTKIQKSYLDAMERFLNSESWMVSQRPIAANFLNDGVISKDFLDAGLAVSLIPYLPEKFKHELQEKLAKEKNYVPYAHAFAPQLSAVSVWSLFAPDIPQKLAVWKNMTKAFERESFEDRIALFLAQKKFPPSFLSQVMRYQQREYLSFGQDPRLMKDDLGIFGYHSLSDWFGSEFMNAVCRSIIQTAAIARKKGYTVSKGEVLGELLSSSQKMYESLREKCDLPVSNGEGLLHLYLRQNGFDQKIVERIWEDVTLFRKYLATVGSGALVDFLAIQNFYAYAHENVSVELYQMPKDFRFQTIEELKKFEAYIEAVGSKRKSPLDLPTGYADLSEIEKKAPELVGKKYRLFIAEVSHESLSGKVSVKETWGWECEPKNWELLKKEFPELAQKTGEPLEILEKTDLKTRKRIDGFSRKQIIASHPEWAIECLKEKSMDEKDIFLTTLTEKPLVGIQDPVAFQKVLDEKDEIIGYTQDGDHIFRILVQERGDKKSVLTFKEALKSGVLDNTVKRFNADALVSQIINELSLKHLSSKESADKKEEKALPYRFVEFLEKRDEKDAGLSEQWKIEKKALTITRSDPSFLSFDEVLALEPNGVSKIKADPKEGPFFYKLLETKIDSGIPLDKIALSQSILAKEAKRNFFENLLKEISKS